MPKKSSNKIRRKDKASDPVDAQTWISLQTYGQLKEWLREATQHQIYFPVVIPHNVMPVAYLTQLLEKSEPQTKIYLRTIIPELIKEWGRNDNPQCLDDLLVLCGHLNCNEAENAISRIVTEKLTQTPEHIELRLRALSVLQEIGTDRSLHIFKRYVGEFDYAAICYRSLYLLNRNYAVTELQELMTLYENYNAPDQLEDVLKILFKYTLTPPQYICVLQPLVDLTGSETFVKVLELLHRLDILNPAFFIQLSPISRVEFIKQIMKRSKKEEEAKRIIDLLKACDARLDPPVDIWVSAEQRNEREKPFTIHFPDVADLEVITPSELGGEHESMRFCNVEERDVLLALDGQLNLIRARSAISDRH